MDGMGIYANTQISTNQIDWVDEERPKSIHGDGIPPKTFVKCYSFEGVKQIWASMLYNMTKGCGRFVHIYIYT